MALVVLDSGGVSCLSRRSREAVALLAALRREGAWPPLVPSEVLVESLTGDPRRDANTNSLLKTCDVGESLPVIRARRAASLRARARRGSAVDAIVIASAEPGGTVLTSDPGDLGALAEFANGVEIEAV